MRYLVFAIRSATVYVTLQPSQPLLLQRDSAPMPLVLPLKHEYFTHVPRVGIAVCAGQPGSSFTQVNLKGASDDSRWRWLGSFRCGRRPTAAVTMTKVYGRPGKVIKLLKHKQDREGLSRVIHSLPTVPKRKRAKVRGTSYFFSGFPYITVRFIIKVLLFIIQQALSLCTSRCAMANR